MTETALPFTAAILGISLTAGWVVRRMLLTLARSDGAPSAELTRWLAEIDILAAGLLAAVAVGSAGHLVIFAHAWRHDFWSALFLGALAGSFLHVAGGGSPLPIASIRPRLLSVEKTAPDRIDPGTVVLFLLGELATILVWFGAGLPAALHVLPRFLGLALIASGYGLRRAAAGQDHALLGAIDGLLMGLLYLLTGSLIAVVVAHIVADVLSYVSAAGEVTERETAIAANVAPGAGLGGL